MSKQSTEAAFDARLLGASADDALSAVNGVGADEQAELVEAWIAKGNIAAVAAIARIDDAPSPARKAARRGLNVLKARGLTVPEGSTVARPLAAKDKPTTEARFTPPDGSGTCLLTFITRSHGKDPQVVDVVFEENAGVVRCSGGTISGGKLRDWEQSSKSRRGFAAAIVPLDWARHRVAVAREKNKTSGALLPLELDAFADVLAATSAAEIPHPVLAKGLEPKDDEIAAIVAESAELHRHPELAPFTPSRRAVDELLMKIGERLGPGGTDVDQEKFLPILAEEAFAATDRFFDEAVRTVLASRLLDASIAIQARAGDDAAKKVLGIRKAILAAGLITQPPRDIPFLRAFFDKAIQIMASQTGGRLSIPLPAKAAGGLQLSPEQLAAVESAKTETVSAG